MTNKAKAGRSGRHMKTSGVLGSALSPRFKIFIPLQYPQLTNFTENYDPSCSLPSLAPPLPTLSSELGTYFLVISF